MATHSSVLAWNVHGQRSLAGYSPWGHKESDMTEHTLSDKQKLCLVPYQRSMVYWDLVYKNRIGNETRG